MGGYHPITFSGCAVIGGSRFVANYPAIKRHSRGPRDRGCWPFSACADARILQRPGHAAFTAEVERVRDRLKQSGPRNAIFPGHNCMA
jgi:hypothetical protein